MEWVGWPAWLVVWAVGVVYLVFGAPYLIGWAAESMKAPVAEEVPAQPPADADSQGA
jgi:hypothetical protein